MQASLTQQALALANRYRQEQLRYTVIPVDPIGQLFQRGRLYIWAGASDLTIYPDASLNWLFRAHHDTLHLASGLGFSLAEEIEVTKKGIHQLALDTSPDLARLYWLDNVGQQLSFYHDGQFPADQKVFIQSIWDNPEFTQPRT